MNDIFLGATHITDLAGFDHILFLIALAASYDLTKFVRMVLLATAFTIGHSLTLFLAGLDLVRASLSWIEFLIPVTIIIMSILQILGSKLDTSYKKSISRTLFRNPIYIIRGFQSEA